MLAVTLITTVVAVTAMPIRAAASETTKGATRQVQLSHPDLANRAVTADESVMTCPNCRDEIVTSSTWAGKGAFKKTTITKQHMCPSCKNVITYVGHGKDRTAQVKHVCEKCKS